MAGGRIKGITIEIDGSTTGLDKALKATDSNISSVQRSLQDVNRLLKVDPSSTELLSQKQKLLSQAVSETKDRLDALKEASQQAAKTAGNYDAWKAAYAPIQEEIGKTQEKTKELKEKMSELEKAGKVDTSEYKALGEELKVEQGHLTELKQKAKDVSEEFGNPISHEQYDLLQREIIETEQNLKNLEEQAKKSASVLGTQMQEAGRKMNEAGDNISEVGKNFTTKVSAPIAGLGTVAVKTVADFDSAMSQVSAVSGATGDDFLALRDKAREMGAKTKFSASEAAEAMNYMAMAGWKAGDMMDGIEGIMNLAAASGENLGTTSDIVTDALTAFGLSAADSGHFADILAQASASANTNVSMLGESFKYVAPVAGTLGYSAEDTAIALGIMANAGIKGSQAGTSLRSALTNMVKPTKDMVGVMNSFGIEIENADSTMKPFRELLGELREKFRITTEAERDQNYAMAEQEMRAWGLGDRLEGLTEEQKKLAIAQYYGTGVIEGMGKGQLKQAAADMLNIKLTKERTLTEEEYDKLALSLGKDALDGLTEAKQAEAAATLFGKEAMSGMLNIINASEADFEKLTGAIYNCDGAAEGMANTMLDNLNGQITVLMSGLQELAISIGDILIPAMRDIVSWVQGVVDKLNSMDEGTRETIVKIALLAAAIGPVLVSIGKIISAVGAVTNGVGKLLPILVSVGTAITGTIIPAIGSGIAAFGAFLVPILPIVAAISGVIAVGVLLYKNWDTIKEKADEIWSAISAFFGEVWNAIYTTVSTWLNNVYETVSSIFNSCLECIQTIWETIKNVIQVAIMFIAELFQAAFEILTVPFQFIWENCKEYIMAAWEFIKEIVASGIEAVKNTVETVFNAVALFIQGIWDNISSAINTAWEFIKMAVEVAITAVKMTVETVFDAVASFVKSIWDGICNAIQAAWDFIRMAVEVAITAVQVTVSTVFDKVRDQVASVWEKIKTAILTPINKAKETLSETLDKIRDKVTSIFDALKDKVTNVWNDIKSAITKPITDAKNTVSDLIDKIKEKFNFQWSLPSLKLPHPTISGSFSLNPPSVPSFGIEWYRKAMDSAMVMDMPTVFGYNARTNQLLAGGEAGREVVSGEDHLVSLIGSVVREQYGQLGSQVDRLTAVVQQYFLQVVGQMERDVVLDSGALVGQLAPKMDGRLGMIQGYKERWN